MSYKCSGSKIKDITMGQDDDNGKQGEGVNPHLGLAAIERAFSRLERIQVQLGLWAYFHITNAEMEGEEGERASWMNFVSFGLT